MKQITAFEGYYDEEAGWEFDMPIIMVLPTFRWGEGGNSGHVDSMVEDYLIDWGCDGQQPEDESCDDFEMSTIKEEFEAAKEGKPKSPGQSYWKRVIEWDPNDEDCNWKTLESIG